jgi:hypothetical protein
VFLISHRLYKNVSAERIMVTEKLLGIFLAALAVQLMIDGLVDLHIITVGVHEPSANRFEHLHRCPANWSLNRT